MSASSELRDSRTGGLYFEPGGLVKYGLITIAFQLDGESACYSALTQFSERDICMFFPLPGSRRPRIFGAFVFLVMVLVSSTSKAADAQNQDQRLAEEGANQFWFSYDRGDLSTLYKSLSKAFRDQITEAQFVQQVGLMRIQAGGTALTRTLVGSQLLNSPPGFPDGDYFYVRYKSQYPNSPVFQDTMLMRSDATWRIYSFNVLGAPPDQ